MNGCSVSQRRIMWQPALMVGLAVPLMGTPFPESALFSEKQWEELLMDRLLDGYNDLVLPLENASKPVSVWFGLSLVQLLQIDEQRQVTVTDLGGGYET